MIERILPPSVAAAEVFGCDSVGTLRQQRAVALTSVGWQGDGDAFPCADVVLERLAWPTGPAHWSTCTAPQWPKGMTGSYTSCAGYRAAAVALTRDIVALAIDAQCNLPLPDDGMLEMVAYEEERQRVADLTARIPEICWDRLLFSAKLAVYKTWFPSATWWLNLELADIMIDENGNTFKASLLVPGPVVDGKPLTEIRGRWLSHDGLLVTGVVVR